MYVINDVFACHRTFVKICLLLFFTHPCFDVSGNDKNLPNCAYAWARRVYKRTVRKSFAGRSVKFNLKPRKPIGYVWVRGLRNTLLIPTRGLSSGTFINQALADVSTIFYARRKGVYFFLFFFCSFFTHTGRKTNRVLNTRRVNGDESIFKTRVYTYGRRTFDKTHLSCVHKSHGHFSNEWFFTVSRTGGFSVVFTFTVSTTPSGCSSSSAFECRLRPKTTTLIHQMTHCSGYDRSVRNDLLTTRVSYE